MLDSLAGAYYLAQRECGPGTLYYRAMASSVSLRNAVSHTTKRDKCIVNLYILCYKFTIHLERIIYYTLLWEGTQTDKQRSSR